MLNLISKMPKIKAKLKKNKISLQNYIKSTIEMKEAMERIHQEYLKKSQNIGPFYVLKNYSLF